MSAVEFDTVNKLLDKLYSKIDELQKRPDYVTNDRICAAVDKLMEKCFFECELPLFL